MLSGPPARSDVPDASHARRAAHLQDAQRLQPHRRGARRALRRPRRSAAGGILRQRVRAGRARRHARVLRHPPHRPSRISSASSLTLRRNQNGVWPTCLSAGELRGVCMRWRMWSLAMWLAILCVCAAASSGRAQTVASAGVTGTVRDSSEALVPGATVDIRNHATNQVWSTVTDERGRFRLPYPPAGDYHLSVQLSGFTTTNAGLTLGVGDQVDVPIVLKPAAVNESVQVEAPAPLVEARRTEMASAITPREVDSLPLNGRNYLDLALLAPDVSRTNLRTTDRFAETSAVPGTGVSVSGQRNLNNNFV